MAEPTPDYKDTILLPQTEFQMRGQLPTTEPITLKRWNDTGVYKKMLDSNKGNPKFVLPDGPPYANGSIHVGHVLNKVLKDIVIKYKNMQGFYSAFIPGWDCHGLPIELAVTSVLKEKARDLSAPEMRKLCKAEALKWINIQREQFARLGVLAEWENPYLTLHPKYEAEEIRVLAQILKNGILYRGTKPVYWCPALQTALAAAEVEYHDKKDPSIFVRFFATDDFKKRFGMAGKKLSFVIWTTTPWTLPANVGIAAGSHFDYGFYQTGDEVVIVAAEMKEKFEATTGMQLTELKVVKGSELEDTATQESGYSAIHPFMKRFSKIITGSHVTLETGTGLVHTAPGHGLEDYAAGLKHKLPVLSPVDAAGKFTDEVPQYVGMKIWDGNKKIVEDLKASGHLVHFSEFVHSFPHNPRTKTPLIFRATPQWFVRMDDETFNLRKLALETCKDTLKFVPEWGRHRLESMVENTPDWCLSRQRVWGVPIPVFECEACGETLADPDVFEAVAKRVETDPEGAEVFYTQPPETFVGDRKCKCGQKKWARGKDTLDVWFDSGCFHTAVPKEREEMSFPADIYLEGSDQHRGWFQTSLLSSLAAYKKPPYKALITHGFVNDAQGLKMSKSKGNTVDPKTIIDKYGAEMLRLWVAYEDYGQDVTIGNEIFERISDTYRRIRNSVRFMLGNLFDFNPQTDVVPFEQMPMIDKWILGRLNDLTQKMQTAYDEYNFYRVYHALNQFFTVDLSAIYCDVLKDRLYTWKKDGVHRRSSQTALYLVLKSLTPAMAPILSYLADEIYRFLPGDKKENVFLEKFPKFNPDWNDEKLAARMQRILEIRGLVSKSLEDLRQQKTIGSNLDAGVVLTLLEKDHAELLPFLKDLREILIVSSLELKIGSELKVEVKKAAGEKCPRCWNFNTNLKGAEKAPGVCPKCVEALT